MTVICYNKLSTYFEQEKVIDKANITIINF